MTLTDALVNSLGLCVMVPSGLASFRVLRVRKPWSLSHMASSFNVVVPAKYVLNISATASPSAGTMWMPPGCSASQVCLRSPCSFTQQDWGHLFYNFSVLHCLLQAMGFPDSAGTGTVIKPSILRRYATGAGFNTVEVLVTAFTIIGRFVAVQPVRPSIDSSRCPVPESLAGWYALSQG